MVVLPGRRLGDLVSMLVVVQAVELLGWWATVGTARHGGGETRRGGEGERSNRNVRGGTGYKKTREKSDKERIGRGTAVATSEELRHYAEGDGRQNGMEDLHRDDTGGGQRRLH